MATPSNSCGATPTIVKGSFWSAIVFPTIPGSPPKRLRSPLPFSPEKQPSRTLETEEGAA